jgi:hypothetical protein
LLIEAPAGNTVIDCKIAVTFRLPDPTIVPELACIDVLPETSPVARPVAFTLATAVFVDFHATNVVMFELTPPLNSPVAVNCC